MSERGEGVLVLYVPGLDLRRVDAERTPFLHGLLGGGDWVRLRGLPSTELVPSMVTGLYPHQHGVWQVRLLPPGRRGPRTAGERLLAALPDRIGTLLQGATHALTGRMDLATLPPRRRARFELRRFKYERRESGRLVRIRDRETVFSLLGPARSRYVFTRRFRELPRLARELPSGRHELEFLEMYALDLTQHWNLDRLEVVDRIYRDVDDFARSLAERCAGRGTTLLVLSDHGQERVVGTLDVFGALRSLGLGADEMDCYVEVPSARFWFHTDRAARLAPEALAELGRVSLRGYREMHEYDVRFDTDAYGHLYALADPGWIFFPHDFFDPIANLYLGLLDGQQRPRVWNPVHRGCHGYAPEHPSEAGFLVSADERWRPRAAWGKVVDVAPTLLEMAGAPVPAEMEGSPLLARAV